MSVQNFLGNVSPLLVPLSIIDNYLSEIEKKNETVDYLDVLRAGIVKDIDQLCEREKVDLILLCKKTKSETLSLCDRKRGNNGESNSRKSGIKSLWKRRRPRRTVC